MKFHLTFFLMYVIVQVTNCQNEYYPNLRHDNVWIFGKNKSGNKMLAFDSDTLNLKPKLPSDIGLGGASVFMSNQQGILKFFTNGVSIFNSQLKVMKNGSRINPGSFITDYNWQSTGLPLTQSSIALSFPQNDSTYLLLHQDWCVESRDSGLYHSCPFYYSKVNMNRENGLGEVIEINQSINNDSVSPSNIMACRHANGRDWWVLAKQRYIATYNNYIATSNTVKYEFSQNVPVGNGPYNEPYGQATFTPNGKKYIQVSAPARKRPGYFDIYDFDRCSGALSNHQRIQFQDSVYYIVLGGAVSPNSRFLYVSRWDYILQFDLEAADILATIDTVATYDGFWSPTAGGCRTTFMNCQLALDGKIYVSVGPCSTEYLHIIHEPNIRGKACNVEQHAVYLTVSNLFMIPNAPNYRLGKLKGSPCDTLKVANKDITSDDYGLKIFPNPASTEIRVDLSLPDYDPAISTEIVLVDISGEIVQKYAMPDFVSLATLDISKLTSGVYGVQLRQWNRVLAVEKLVVIR